MMCCQATLTFCHRISPRHATRLHTAQYPPSFFTLRQGSSSLAGNQPLCESGGSYIIKDGRYSQLYLVCISSTVLCFTVRALVSQFFSCFKRYKGRLGVPRQRKIADEGTTGWILDLEEDGGRHEER